MMTFTIYGDPRGKERARTFYNERIHKMASVTPEKTRNYEDLVRYCFTAAGGKRTSLPVKVKIAVYSKIPSTMPKYVYREALAGMVLPTVKPDNDNIEKIVFDALNGFAWRDDTQVVENYTLKRYSEEPRVEITIEDLECAYYRVNGKWVKE